MRRFGMLLCTIPVLGFGIGLGLGTLVGFVPAIIIWILLSPVIVVMAWKIWRRKQPDRISPPAR